MRIRVPGSVIRQGCVRPRSRNRGVTRPSPALPTYTQVKPQIRGLVCPRSPEVGTEGRFAGTFRDASRTIEKFRQTDLTGCRIGNADRYRRGFRVTSSYDRSPQPPPLPALPPLPAPRRHPAGRHGGTKVSRSSQAHRLSSHTTKSPGISGRVITISLVAERLSAYFRIRAARRQYTVRASLVPKLSS